MSKILLIGLLFSAFPLFADDLTLTYRVPAPEHLLELSFFEIPAHIDRHDDGSIVLSYNLPTDLIGTSYARPVQLRGRPQEGRFQMTWKNGDLADCEGSEEQNTLECAIRYQLPELDIEQTRAFLEEIYAADPILLKNKIELATLFSADPIGSLTFGFQKTESTYRSTR